MPAYDNGKSSSTMASVGTLTKLNQLKDSPHVKVGESIKGFIIQFPVIGNKCIVGNVQTSNVVNILDAGDSHVKFETLNSIYLLQW